MWKSIADWLRQPSTILGLSALGTLVGVPPGTLDLLGNIIVGGAGLAGILLNDKP